MKHNNYASYQPSLSRHNIERLCFNFATVRISQYEDPSNQDETGQRKKVSVRFRAVLVSVVSSAGVGN